MHPSPALCLLVLTLALASSLWQPATAASRQLLISEVGPTILNHNTTLCNPAVVGSVAGCYNKHIKAQGNDDYPLNASMVSYPTNGTPWGIHLSGPYPDSITYLLSWTSGEPTVGTAAMLEAKLHASAAAPAIVKLSTTQGAAHNGEFVRNGNVISYRRLYLVNPEADYGDYFNGNTNWSNMSYLSPPISHVLLTQLNASTTYYYTVGDGTHWSAESSFKTLPSFSSTTKYPFRVGLMGDAGQTVNSSQTRDHLTASKPDVIINVGDLTYADHYRPDDSVENSGDISNQRRWDSHIQMWTPLWSTVPVCNFPGNHEIEMGAINATINYTTTNFTFPNNYPFQTYSARYPAPGVTSDFGNINQNMYYSTVIGGSITLITLNNYIPFHAGTPQYKWALEAFKAVNRTATPWLFVGFHAPHYHTYINHYKEMACFMSFYEDIFYQYGVDLVLNGHVHAYERTHPVYKYKVDSCAPVYITIGDGGNIEGPYRDFVDQVNINTNATFCAGLKAHGKNPNQAWAANSSWGVPIQEQAQPPSCPTMLWEAPSGSLSGPVLVPKDGSNGTLGWCQSSQPTWSAARDPSFGHGTLDILSDSTLRMKWYRNVDSQAQVADSVVLQRLDYCRTYVAAGHVRRARKGRRANRAHAARKA